MYLTSCTRERKRDTNLMKVDIDVTENAHKNTKHVWPHIVQRSIQAVEAHFISAVWTDGGGGKGAWILLQLQVQLPCRLILRVFLRHRAHDEVRVQRSHSWKFLLGGVLLCHCSATLAGCKHYRRRKKVHYYIKNVYFFFTINNF